MAENPSFKSPSREDFDKFKAWSDKWSNFIASNYNSQLPKQDIGLGATGNNGYGRGTPYSNATNNFGAGPIFQILKNYRYYAGNQPNNDYAWSENDPSGVAYGPTWIPGKKVQQLVDDTDGKALRILQNMKISTRALSEAATNKRTESLEKWRFYNAIKPVVDQLGLQEMGIEYSPLGGAEQDFDLPEQVYDYLEKNYKDEMEEYAKIIADDFYARNDGITYFRKVFKDAVIGGISATEFYAKGNRVWTRDYEGDCIIWDNGEDDPLNRNARFVGLIRYMTPSEILDTWTEKQLGAEGYKKIKEIAENPARATAGFIPNITETGLAGYMNNDLVLTLPILTTYWRASKDTRYVETDADKYGNKHVVKKSKEDSTEGKYWMETWFTNTMISSVCTVDAGECYNNVERLTDKRRIECPVKVFMPNITRGGLMSLVGKLYQHQDRKDFLMNEITKYIDKAYGRVLAINGQKLGDTKFSDVVEDFKRYGVSVVNINATGDEDDPDKNRPLMEAYDMTLDPNVSMYLTLMQEEDRIMQEIAGASAVSLGQQQGYISVGSQQATIGQNSTQTFSLYMSFMRFVSMVLEHAVNMQKNMLAGAEGEENQRIPLIGEQGIQYLKKIEDFGLEDFGIYIRIEDQIDEVGKQQITELALAWSQNIQLGVTPLDVLKVINSKTYTEAYQVLEAAFARNKRDQARAEQQQMAMQQMQQAQMMQEAAAVEQYKQENENQRTTAKNDTKLEETRMKVEGSMANQVLASTLPKEQAMQ